MFNKVMQYFIDIIKLIAKDQKSEKVIEKKIVPKPPVVTDFYFRDIFNHNNYSFNHPLNHGHIFPYFA